MGFQSLTDPLVGTGFFQNAVDIGAQLHDGGPLFHGGLVQLVGGEAAILVPLTNTGIFLVGCRLFFFDTIKEWAAGMGFENAFTYMIVGLVGINFIFELVINIILSPSVVGIVNILSKKRH